MNERIKLLIEQATEQNYTTWDYYNQKTVVHYEFNKEKFAELIVKECATLIDAEEIQSRYGNMLKEHFGVEE